MLASVLDQLSWPDFLARRLTCNGREEPEPRGQPYHLGGDRACAKHLGKSAPGKRDRPVLRPVQIDTPAEIRTIEANLLVRYSLPRDAINRPRMKRNLATSISAVDRK